MFDDLLKEIGTGATFSNVLLIWALIMARVMPMIVFAPFVGGELVPAQVKIAIGIAFSLILFPYLSSTRLPASAIIFMLLMLKEAFIGLTIAFAATLAFEAARAAGTLVDTVSGANMATVFVPQIGQQASIIADFKFQLAIVIFLTLNGHHLVLGALFESFRVIPLQGWPRFSHGFWPLFALVITTSAQFIVLAVALAAPAAIATFLTDLTLGLVNRVAPSIQVFFISMAIKPMVAVFMVLVSLTVIYDQLLVMFQALIKHTRDVVTLFG